MTGNGFSLSLVPPAKVNVINDNQVLPDGTDMLTSDKERVKGDNIGNYIQNHLFTYYRNARRNEQEEICLDCERAYNNKYNLAQQAILAKRNQETGDSTVWVPITRTKVNIAVAKTFEKMINTSDNPWSIIPEQISEEEIQLNKFMVMKAQAAGALNEDPERALDKLKDLNERESQDKCDSMEQEIADQMSQGNVFIDIGKTVLQQHYLGTGIGKFEITVSEDERWKETANGWELIKTEKPFPKVVFANWFNVFFDPYGTGTDVDAIQRHVVKRSKLKSYSAAQGFKPDIIDEVIRNNPSGNHIDLDYETTIRGINNQEQSIQHCDGYYDLYEAWVELSGDKLIEYGYTDGIEPTQAYKMNCWVCDNRTIKLIRNPHKPQRSPFFVVPYEENTTSVNGTGIGENLFGIQEVINSVTRATVDNAAWSHGPITEVNESFMKQGKEIGSIKPGGTYFREGGDPKEPMLRFYNIPENSGVLHNVYNIFSQIGEDATGISSSTEESLPAANTPNMGISMTLSQKNILQRTVIGNIDKYLFKPMIKMYYDFNMQWNERNDIKTPAKVTANGVTSIIAKEMRSQQLMAFANITNNPEDKDIVNRKTILENLANSLDQDGETLVYSDTEAEEHQKANSESQMQAVQAEQQGLIGQIDAENRGEIEQERIKGDLAMRKQRLIELSKLQQIVMKEEADVNAAEMNHINQMQTMQQNSQQINQGN